MFGKELLGALLVGLLADSVGASEAMWPPGRALPRFGTPAQPMDGVEIRVLDADERITLSALQGQVNRAKPRIMLLDARAEEGRDTWIETLDLKVVPVLGRDAFEKVVAKYADEVSGAVLYDTAKSEHFRNLAGTAAGVMKALPVTPDILRRLREHGVELKVVEDLTGLELTSALEIYGHLHQHYWPRCEKRLLVSARPWSRGGDHHHTRDLAAAFGAAVVWLDPREKEERDLLRRFFSDMKPGEAVVLGWYASERSGITTASEFGIGTLPADFYMNPSVYSGSDEEIRIPAVPKMPELEDKAYIAIFISDGDNIQYVQRAMRRLWDRSSGARGKMPLNWTIAPGLVDIGPGLLNYYYDTATSEDCFVSGPSGMGYMMPSNTLREEGAPLGLHTADEERMAAYARLSGEYLRRAGLRVVTIWDDASPMQRREYAKHAPELYGATVQNFKDVPEVESGVVGGLRFEKLEIPYAGSREHLEGSMRRQLRRWDGEKPLFVAYQVDVWNELRPERLLEIREALRRDFGERVEFVRADHYFNLQARAAGRPFSLAMAASTTARGEGEPSTAIDGTPVTVWEGAELVLDFGKEFTLAGGRMRVAGEGAYSLEICETGGAWESVAAVGAGGVFSAKGRVARFARVRGEVGIAELEIYGVD